MAPVTGSLSAGLARTYMGAGAATEKHMTRKALRLYDARWKPLVLVVLALALWPGSRAFAADGSEIFIEKLIGRRQNRFGGDGSFGRLGFGLGVFGGDKGSGDGIGGAAMAGIAGHIAVSFEIVFVDGEHHLHHFAGGDFRLLVVFLEIETFIAADVAILAFDAERGGADVPGGRVCAACLPS